MISSPAPTRWPGWQARTHVLVRAGGEADRRGWTITAAAAWDVLNEVAN